MNGTRRAVTPNSSRVRNEFAGITVGDPRGYRGCARQPGGRHGQPGWRGNGRRSREARIRELAQLYREEVLVQRSRRAAAGADEVVRYPLPQLCLIGHPGPKLSGVRSGAEQAAVNLLSLPPFFPFLSDRIAIVPMLFMAAPPGVRGQAARIHPEARAGMWDGAVRRPCRTAAIRNASVGH